MRKAISCFVSLFFTSSIFVGVSPSQNYDNLGATYDHESGNYWEWYLDSSGNRRIRGFNYKSGSTWRAITEPDADAYGFSEDGFYWRYEKGTGFSIRFDNKIEDLKILLDKGLITKEEFNKKKAELLNF